jgi:predicted dehydrogenase
VEHRSASTEKEIIMGDKVRVGIVGLDHWYAGLGAMRQLKDHDRTELVIVSHRDLGHAQASIEEAGAIATDDYDEVVERDDLDLVITACRTAENVELCSKAARSGKHIVSVKPYAMDLDEARALAVAVKEGGVFFMSFECSGRLASASNVYKQWIDEGRLGDPISVFALMRGTLPIQLWPEVYGRTWWLDPSQVFGGGWMDHAIYQIDSLRYILGSEVVRVSGEISNIKHKDEPLEDFGVANLVFGNGCVATIEVTWSTDPGAGIHAFHLVGTKGHIVSEPTIAPGKLFTVDMSQGKGWEQVEAPSRRSTASLVDHMLDCMEGKAEPVTGLYDSYKNLEVCLAFYEAAQYHEVVCL